MEASPPPLPPVSAAFAQGIRDEENLRVLGICHYVVGGFIALFASIFIFHIAMGLMIAAGSFPMGTTPGYYPKLHVTVPGYTSGPEAQTPSDNVAVPAPPKPSATPFSPYADTPRQDRPFASDQSDHPRPVQVEMPRAIGFLFVGIGTVVVLLGWTIGGLTIYAGRCLQRRRHRTFTFVMAGINCLHVPFGTALGVFTIIVLQRPSVAALYAASQHVGQPLNASV